LSVIIIHTGNTFVPVGFVLVYCGEELVFTYNTSPGFNVPPLIDADVGKNARGTVVVSKYFPNGRNENQSVPGVFTDVTTPIVF
jgi:hypothetical protein